VVVLRESAVKRIGVPALTAAPPEPAFLEAGIRPSLSVATLAEKGITGEAPPTATVTLVDLVSPGRDTEYWLGFENFYVITRYNRSSFYAMAVFQLAEAIRGRAGEGAGGKVEGLR
jgi:membrane-bound lytic murein transglycosylase B